MSLLQRIWDGVTEPRPNLTVYDSQPKDSAPVNPFGVSPVGQPEIPGGSILEIVLLFTVVVVVITFGITLIVGIVTELPPYLPY